MTDDDGYGLTDFDNFRFFLYVLIPTILCYGHNRFKYQVSVVLLYKASVSNMSPICVKEDVLFLHWGLLHIGH